MPSAELDTAILDSTLWSDRDARDIFITSRLLAEPRDIEATDALDPETGERAGYRIPAGEYGFVAAAGPGIVRRAMLEPEPGLKALQRLCAPDAQSRTKAHEGRRMARIDGGFVILNFALYRKKDRTATERAQRYRARKTEIALIDAAPWFVAFKAAYPQRAGDQGWKKAYRAACQRLKEGHTTEDIIAGARRYRDFVRFYGKEGTEFVKQAATFVGRDEHFLLHLG
jgi:hypothetical protein